MSIIRVIVRGLAFAAVGIASVVPMGHAQARCPDWREYQNEFAPLLFR